MICCGVAAVTPERGKHSKRAHSILRLVAVVLVLAFVVRASYHITLATEQLFRISRGGAG